MKYKYIRVPQFIISSRYSGRLFSYGNAKLPKYVLIVNMVSAKNCPSDLRGFCRCSDICYAKKCEKLYRTYGNKMKQVEAVFDSASERDIFNAICDYIDHAPEPIKYIRVNESGDFRTQKDIDMWCRFNDLLKQIYPYFKNVTAYTCRIDLDFSNINFVLNASRYDVNNYNRVFKAVTAEVFDKLKNGKKKYKCLGAGGCKKCHVCFNPVFDGTIYCKIH